MLGHTGRVAGLVYVFHSRHVNSYAEELGL
jgi:hypothetical protein